jgi:hypothetical protein
MFAQFFGRKYFKNHKRRSLTSRFRIPYRIFSFLFFIDSGRIRQPRLNMDKLDLFALFALFCDTFSQLDNYPHHGRL